MKASTSLVEGKVYTRDELRLLFNIIDASINNGIFKPYGHESIWLFVPEEKTPDRTQYHDRLDGNVLEMDGQTLGRTDHLIQFHATTGMSFYSSTGPENISSRALASVTKGGFATSGTNVGGRPTSGWSVLTTPDTPPPPARLGSRPAGYGTTAR